MAGDEETGVTIHRTTAELDAGPIAAQQAFAVGPEDDAGAVYERSAALAVDLLDRVLPDGPDFRAAARGRRHVRGEDPPGRPRARPLAAAHEELVNRVRALSPHIGARAELDGRDVIVWRARVEDGRFVPVEVQPAGKRRMTYEEFRRGLRA